MIKETEIDILRSCRAGEDWYVAFVFYGEDPTAACVCSNRRPMIKQYNIDSYYNIKLVFEI